MVAPSGTAKKRSFSAPSLQSGALTSYGISPGAGFFGSAGSTHPVADRRSGNVDGALGPFGTSL